MFMSREQSVAQNQNLRIANKSSQTVTNFEYLARTRKNQICMREEIKCLLNARNAWYGSVQKLWFPSLVSKNINKV
jgi:hypothetical protein